jgi:hypothetical protein
MINTDKNNKVFNILKPKRVSVIEPKKIKPLNKKRTKEKIKF